MAVPTLFYVSKCWTLSVNQRTRLESAEMRFLRPAVRRINMAEHTIKTQEINYMYY